MYSRACVLLFASVVGRLWAADPFTPGCSFVGGQCMYTVQLGHQGQCDAQTPQVATAGDSQCCTAVQNDIVGLKTDVEVLKAQVTTLVGSLNKTTADLQAATAHSKTVEAERDSLLEMLHRRELELNKTEAELARMLGQAGDEIRALRQDLTNVTNALASCRTALGVSTTDNGQPVSLLGAVEQWYCSFQVLDDCGYKRLTGTASFSLMQHGSSLSTGPRVDHSTGIASGTYMGLNAVGVADMYYSSQTKRDATMESDVFQPANGYCVLFWYSMRGADVLQLDVNVRIGGGTGYPVWTRKGDQKVDWLLGEVDLDIEYTANPFKIDFVASSDAYKTYSSSTGGYIQHNHLGDIGIDDIYVYNTSCANVPKCPPTSTKNTLNNVTSCYTFHVTALSWKDAYDVCRREGPHSGLVSVDTQEEQNFLVSVINHDPALTVVGQNGFYTSGSDYGREHNFAWTDSGSQRSVSWPGWHTGQPNNVGGNQNCLLMQYPADGYTWGDIECDSKHPFICEVYY
ncbi:unnamed protein product [Lymnaea stagnalis]|uniref:C-type lectin n=1 Tax=Lymnaea stagnalis TaxID=6523 RepID=A0AAV2I261_LYMST